MWYTNHKQAKRVTISLLIFTFVFSAYGYEESEAFVVDVPTLQHINRGGISEFVIDGFGSTMDLYYPSLPVKTYYYEIPDGAKNFKIELVSITSSMLHEIQAVREVLPPMPANKDKKYVPPIRKTKDFDRYPGEHFRFDGFKVMDGHNILAITVFPVLYYPDSDQIEYTHRYEFSIKYNHPRLMKAKKAKKKATGATEGLAKEIIANIGSGSGPITQDLPAGTSVKYAIITTNALKSALEPLAEWKSAKGIPAEVYTTEDIYANYSGSDNPEKIRNFLIDLENESNLDWILIGGDDADVPARDAFCYDGYAPDGDYLPTDYYYADLTGSYTPYDWDFDNDSIHGEIPDQIDWLPEAYVGRLSTSNLAQMEDMVDNIIGYEKSPFNGSWTTKAILAGGQIRADTDDAYLMNAIKVDFLDNYGYSYDRIYFRNDNFARDYTLTYANFENQLGGGASLVSWSGHGSYTHTTSSDVGGQTFVNTLTDPTLGEKRPVVYASSCNNGGFDQASSLAESIIRDWGIGVVAGSRVTWGCVAWTGPSQPWNQALSYRFTEQMFDKGKYRQGQALYDSKVDYISDFSAFYHPDDSNSSRKDLYAFNLLGDPELNVWTEAPLSININHTQFFDTNKNNTVDVQVLYSSNSSPVAGVTVCVQNGADVYETGTTDGSGEITFSPVNSAYSDPITVTALKHNIVPAQGNMTVRGVNVTLLDPIDDEYINPSQINFTYQVNSSYNISECRLIVNGASVDSDNSVAMNTNQTLTWTSITGGLINWGVECTNLNSASNTVSTEQISIILMTEYEGSSTNLSEVDIENITNLIVEKTDYGVINFSEPINLSGGADLDTYIIIEENKISVNSHLLPGLNKSAILTIRNITFPNPVIFRDGILCTDCVILQEGSDFITFNVSHFTTYSVVGSTVEEIRTGTLNPPTAGNDSGYGGNVTQINLSSNVSTNRWQGYFGNVSGSLSFGYGPDIFYNFGPANEVAVYATQNYSFNFLAAEAAAAADIDSVWGYGAGNDQAQDVFTGATTNISGVVAPSVELNPPGQNLNSTILDDSGTNDKSYFAFGALVQKGASCFDGTQCDYELMVPADGLETYYFFLELS